MRLYQDLILSDIHRIDRTSAKICEQYNGTFYCDNGTVNIFTGQDVTYISDLDSTLKI